jgi:hypothetical protein
MIFTKGGTSLTMDRCLYPLLRRVELQQNIGVSEDSIAVVYDNDTTEVFIELDFKHYTYAELDTLRNFFVNTARLALYTITLTPPAGVNLGNGDGGGVVCRYWSSTFLEIMNFYQVYNYKMLLRIENALVYPEGSSYGDDIDDVGYLGGPVS